MKKSELETLCLSTQKLKDDIGKIKKDIMMLKYDTRHDMKLLKYLVNQIIDITKESKTLKPGVSYFNLN